MSEDAPPTANGPDGRVANGRLDSWKEIAAYLKRDVTTVRRWEKRQGLPVHRHLLERRESVYAFTAEIDDWWLGRRNQLARNDAADGGARRVWPLCRGHYDLGGGDLGGALRPSATDVRPRR